MMLAIKMMRKRFGTIGLLLAMVTFVFSACSTSEPEGVFVPLEYQYPMDSLVSLKTFIYDKMGGGDRRFKDVQAVKKDGKDWLIFMQYAATGKTDSFVKLYDRTVETFTFVKETQGWLKGDILQDTLISDGSKFGTKQYKSKMNHHDYSMELSSSMQYMKDTTLMWKNRPVECLVFLGKISNFFQQKGSDKKQEFTSSHHLYFGKYLGLLRYSTHYRGENNVYELLEIVAKK